MNALRHGAAIVSAVRNATRGPAGAILVVGLGVWLFPTFDAGAASVEGPKVYIITHVDVASQPAGPGVVVDRSAMLKKFPAVTAEGETLLRQLALESRRDPGCVSFDVLQEPHRRNHFTVVQVWEDEASLLAHEAAAHTRATREKLQPILGAPLDQRLHVLLK
jgi:quinol monooxygenase YgiN